MPVPALPAEHPLHRRLAEITSATAALRRARNAGCPKGKCARPPTFRFSAVQAYWYLVASQVHERGESRMGDLRTISGFLSRRLAPAMNAGAEAACRQQGLSARIEPASALLCTRVDIAREEQNPRLLAAMDRRAPGVTGPAADRRGAFGGRDHLLRGRPARLSGHRMCDSPV